MAEILFLGGTRFVGRAMAQEALDKGHTVTLLHRGQSGADLFPEANHIHADRESDLSVLKTRTWDVAVDVSGYKPSVVKHSVEALIGQVKRYVFISTISVFSTEDDGQRITETSPLAQMPADRIGDETVDGATYGALKVLCEQAVIDAFGDHALLYRPGLVMGPHDVTDRFTYWVRAGAQADHMEIPTVPTQPVQIADSRDHAAFLIKLIQDHWHGIVNVTGPTTPIDFGALWTTIQNVHNRQIPTVWDTEGFKPMPCAKGGDRFMTAECSQAIELGFETRPMSKTIWDIWEWDQERGLPPLKV